MAKKSSYNSSRFDPLAIIRARGVNHPATAPNFPTPDPKANTAHQHEAIPAGARNINDDSAGKAKMIRQSKANARDVHGVTERR